MNAYETDHTLLTVNDDGTYPLTARHLLVVHTFEGRDLDALAMARYQSTPAAGGSYHIVIDADGVSCRENDDEYIPWAANFTGNRAGFHFSLAGRAAFTREQWLARPKQLATLARILRAYSEARAIPLRKLTPAEVRVKGIGVCGHGDISEAWAESDHTDPGPAFPWDHVLDLAAHPPAPPREEDPDMPLTPRQAHQLDDVTGQLTGSPEPGAFPGYPQLGDRTPVDALAVIGTHLGITGFFDPHAKP